MEKAGPLALEMFSSVSKVRPWQFICQRLNLVTALTAPLDARALAPTPVNQSTSD